MPVAETSQGTSGVAERYASSLFELALEAGTVEAVQAELDKFGALLDESDDLKRLVASPVFSAEDQFKAITAMSPLQFHKRLRLQEARRLMLGEHLDAASAGYRAANVGHSRPL